MTAKYWWNIYTRDEEVTTAKFERRKGGGGQWKHYMRGAGKCVSGDREGYVSDRRTL